MYVGHINLAKSFDDTGEHFARLVEALQIHSVEQYLLVRNIALAKRLDAIADVTVGPVVGSAVTAYCLMPAVDIVHIHDLKSPAAGLLLTLTRGVPYVMSRHVTVDEAKNPLILAARKRAAGFVEDDQMNAIEHLQLYRRVVDTLSVPTMLL